MGYPPTPYISCKLFKTLDLKVDLEVKDWFWVYFLAQRLQNKRLILIMSWGQIWGWRAIL